MRHLVIQFLLASTAMGVQVDEIDRPQLDAAKTAISAQKGRASRMDITYKLRTLYTPAASALQPARFGSHVRQDTEVEVIGAVPFLAINAGSPRRVLGLRPRLAFRI